MLDQVRVLAEDIPTPDVPVPNDLMKYVYLGIAAAIVIAVVLTVIKKIPWWVWAFALIMALAAGGFIKLNK